MLVLDNAGPCSFSLASLREHYVSNDIPSGGHHGQGRHRKQKNPGNAVTVDLDREVYPNVVVHC